MLASQLLLPRDQLRLLGDHNVANALAAALSVHAMGVDAAVIARGLASFQALKHRLEPVREVDGVLWINDSKATNIASTSVVAIKAMTRPFVLLLGGRHKGEPYTDLIGPLAHHAVAVVAYGEAGDLIELRPESCAPGGAWRIVRGRGNQGAGAGPGGRRGPALARLFELRHVYQLRAARCHLPRPGGGDVTPQVKHPGERRWETNGLAVVTLALTAFGIASCYASASYLPDWYHQATQQVSAVLIGGVIFLVAAHSDYHIWKRFATPLFLATLAGLLVIAIAAVVWPHKGGPVESIIPFTNGARRWIKAGVQVQVSEIARFTLAAWLAMKATESSAPRCGTSARGSFPSSGRSASSLCW